MFCLHVYSFSRLKYLLALVLIITQVACSGGATGDPGSTGAASIETQAINILGLSWTAPSAREDGTPLQLSEIASFHIYYGTEAGDYQNQIDINDLSAKSVQVEGLPSGTYYVVLTAIDTDGRESLYTPEIVISL
ncbi:MAG: fibronectin type III domain-containing protein [Gammaproteobacteria bacterium]|nr:fibronectin type III domain-containing protein [Gammaproteobacteria bacterium]